MGREGKRGTGKGEGGGRERRGEMGREEDGKRGKWENRSEKREMTGTRYICTCSSCHTGVAEISGLFSQRDIPPQMKDRYISLLEKFEVALKINSHQMIIPSLMTERASYPKPDDVLSDISSSNIDEVESFYQPPLRRFWFADFVPAGFWPRLICRVATDRQIGRVSEKLSNPAWLTPQ
jgi:hypothetical protein